MHRVSGAIKLEGRSMSGSKVADYPVMSFSIVRMLTYVEIQIQIGLVGR